MSRAKYLTLLAAGIGCGVSASMADKASAADTQDAWAGLAIITASSGCSAVGGTSVGDTHPSVYRPKISGTDTVTYISLLSNIGAVTHKNASESSVHQMNGAGSYTAYAINSRAKYFTYTGTYSLAITPSPVAATTPVVTVDGTINTYFGVAGCNITFQGAYSPR